MIKKNIKIVEITELKQFISLILMMGITKQNNLADYWSYDPLLRCPVIAELMTFNRFNQIYRNISGTMKGDENRLQKLINMLVLNF